MPSIIHFDQTSAPVQSRAVQVQPSHVGGEIAAQGKELSHDFSQLGLALMRYDAQARATQQALAQSGAVADADNAYFAALEQVQAYRHDVKAGLIDRRNFFADVLADGDGILAKAWSDGWRRHGERSNDERDLATFEKQMHARFRPLREKLLTEWTEEAARDMMDRINASATEFSTRATRLTTEWGTPFTVNDVIQEYDGLKHRVDTAVNAQVMTREAGNKFLQDTLSSVFLARQARHFQADPYHADVKVGTESAMIAPLLDAAHQTALLDAKRKGEANYRAEIERQLATNVQLGTMALDDAMDEAAKRKLEVKPILEAAVSAARTRNDLADFAIKNLERDAEDRSRSLADAYEFRVISEPGFDFAAEMRDRVKFHALRNEERTRVFAFQKALREADAALKSDPKTYADLLDLVYMDPDKARSGILGAVGKTLSRGDAEELLKLRGSHLEKLKDKRAQQTHEQYVTNFHDLEERLKTVGGGSTETDPIAIEVKSKYATIYRRMMFDPESTTTHGDELQKWLDILNDDAVAELKRRAAEEGLRIIERMRLYDGEGKPSYAVISSRLKDGLMTPLEAKRARDYIDIAAHNPGVLKPKVTPRENKGIGRKFERVK